MNESGEMKQRKVYAEDVVGLARQNEGEELGEETHEGIDQVLMFVEGEGEAVLDGERRAVRAGSVVVVPAGTLHNFITKGDAPLKLYTVYTPPEHPDGTIHKTKEEAEEYERAHQH
jgi:mannose-6-phosphate isomerase-like protein (cupin superfamily)